MPRDKSQLKDAFWRNHFGFVAEDRYHVVDLPGSFTSKRDALEKTFVHSGRLPNLKGAPVASWVLARLSFLAGRNFPYSYDAVIGSDGADFWLRFYCISEELSPLGLVSLTGSNRGINLWAKHLKQEDGNGICDAFIGEMIASPQSLAKCRIVVQYTEMTDPNIRFIMPRIYGWDGRKFLDGEAPEHAIDPDEYQ
jgi:hypothetical protein